MDKKLLFIIFIAFLGLSILYSLSSYSCPRSYEMMCPFSSSPWISTESGLSSLFMLALIGIFLLTTITFLPEEFVLSLFKPPQHHS